jgi:hypothetical protein
MGDWIAFLTVGEPPEGDTAGHAGAVVRHEVVLAGQGKSLRVVEVEGEEQASDALMQAAGGAGAIPLRCVLNRHHQD